MNLTAAELEQLPLAYRACLSAFEGGTPYAAIASQLQIPKGTVRSRMHRARAFVTALRAGEDATLASSQALDAIIVQAELTAQEPGKTP